MSNLSRWLTIGIMLDFFRVVPKKRVVKIRAKNGVIFSNPNLFRRFIFGCGNGLLILSLAYFFYLYYPLGKAIVNYNVHSRTTTPTADEKYTAVKPTIVENKDTTYLIQIPKILAQANVADDVNPFDKDSYLKALENNNVAQASTSQHPGSGNGTSTYIFAHSTELGLNMVTKNAVFYLLDQLQNDDFVFINYHGIVYKYKVYDRKVVGPKDVEYLSYSENGKEVLILQTCWPIGTNWKRLLIFGQRI